MNNIISINEEGEADLNVIKASVMKFGDYAFYHLGTEEEYFQEYDYEDKDEHIAKHNAYREKVTDFINRLQVSKEAEFRSLVREVAEFSGEWLQSHILWTDKKYIGFVKINKL